MTRDKAVTLHPPRELRLGDLSVSQFLKRHWQRKPLLIRQALAGLANPSSLSIRSSGSTRAPFTVREVFALARDPDVESRLVHAPGATHSAHSSRSWRLRHGPFNRLPSRQQARWSLLVQGVDLHMPAARTLMDRFRFIPDARLDDLMISFATDGGGVGPHVDSYDVFLLQVQGKRRWQISAPRASTPLPALMPGAPLKILADFGAEHDWLLDPGDMLYLPPGWAHEGTAVGECMTCSIGFRSPSVTELRQAFFTFLSDQAPQAQSATRPQRRYRDKTKEPARSPAEIPADMAATLQDWLQDFKPPAQLIERFIGCYLSEPKPGVWFDAQAAARFPLDGAPGIALDRKTRMLYRHDAFFINGEALDSSRSDRPAKALLRALADQRGLDAIQTAGALRQPWLRDRLEGWLSCGWIRHADL